jgi:hypothetical protein
MQFDIESGSLSCGRTKSKFYIDNTLKAEERTTDMRYLKK